MIYIGTNSSSYGMEIFFLSLSAFIELFLKPKDAVTKSL